MKPASTQTDKNMMFDGIGDGPKKGSSRFAHNQWSGHSNDGRLVNKGRGPTTGNDGSCDTPKNLARSVTHDKDRKPMTSPMPAVPKQGSVRDNINREFPLTPRRDRKRSKTGEASLVIWDSIGGRRDKLVDPRLEIPLNEKRERESKEQTKE